MINKETTNTFKDGLVMDLNPITTPNTVLTNCLNGTILTFNGNEHVLQNDMGNGRVETAQLPEGYVPIGTCSYGGIIYIVSYNPLLDRSQIGSFPSPERNIESTELNTSTVVLTPEELVNDEKINSFSVKKQLLDEVNPGDKFIVFTKKFDGRYLSDYGNTDNIDGAFPKLWKLQIALMEESGKINILDNVKWYPNDFHILENAGAFADNATTQDVDEHRSLVNSAYSVVNSKKSGKLVLIASPETIDAFNCTWTVLDSSINKNGTINYDIALDFNWQTSNNDINISSVQIKVEGGESYINRDLSTELTISRFYRPEDATIDNEGNIIPTYNDFKNNYSYDSKIVQNHINDLLNQKIQPKIYVDEKDLTLIRVINNNSTILDRIDDKYLINCTHISKEDDGTIHYYRKLEDNNIVEIFPQEIQDDILNNHFKKSIVRKIFSITVPEDATDIITLTVIPCMPYGKLDHLEQELTIDLSKLGKKNINLNRWRYYTYSDTLMLNWGLDAYAEPNKAITGVDMEFYDNMGRAAVYHVRNKESYNGQFINYINLNGNSNYYDIDDLDHNGQIFFHPKSANLIDSNQINLETGIYFYHKEKYPENPTDTIEDWFDENDKLDLANIELVTEKVLEEWNDSNVIKKVCESDAGIIYSSAIYLVKTNVYYGSINSFGKTEDSETNTFYRWLWTNEIFNDKYDEQIDFKDLNPELYLDIDTRIRTNTNFDLKKFDYSNRKAISDEEVSALDNLSANVQTVGFENSNPNIEVEIGVLFQDNFKTFQLNGTDKTDENGNITSNPLSNIIIKSYLNDLSSKNNPEQPEVINSDENSHLILPKISSEKDFKLPKGVKKQLELTIKEDDKDIWDEGADYGNYAELNLSYKDEDLNDDTIPQFITSQGVIQNNVALKCYETDYNNIFNKNERLNLHFKGIHYSKYYTTSEGQKDVTGRELRPFILEQSDLAKYNLGIVTSNFTKSGQTEYGYKGKFYCTHAVAIGRSRYDSSHHYDDSKILYYKFDPDLSLSTFHDRFFHHKISNKSYKTINTLAKDGDAIATIKNETDFPLIPIIPGPVSTGGNWDGQKTAINRQGKDKYISLSSKRKIDDDMDDITSEEMSKRYGGLLGIITDNNIITDLNHPVSADDFKDSNCVVGPWNHVKLYNSWKSEIGTNVLIHFASYIFSLLTQTYYLSKNVSTSKKYIYDNYTYLVNNQFQYIKDLIISTDCRSNVEFEDIIDDKGNKISIQKSIKNGDLLLMRSINLGEYIDQIFTNSGYKEYSDPNINIEIRNCVKTFPIQLNFEYITPDLKQYDTSNLIYVTSSKSDENVTNSIEWLWDDEQIVYWSEYDSMFKELFSIDKIKDPNDNLIPGEHRFKLYDPTSEESIYNFLNINSTSKLLNLSDWTNGFWLSNELSTNLYNDGGNLKIRNDADSKRITISDKIKLGNQSSSILNGEDHVPMFLDDLSSEYMTKDYFYGE